MMMKFEFIRNNRGATAIEYGLVAALIAIAAVTAMTGVGTKLRSMSSGSASSN